MTIDLDFVGHLAEEDHNLAVMATTRPDGSVHASVVSMGVIDDPIDGAPGVAVVVGGSSRKLDLLRTSGRATLVVKQGFTWAAVAGPVRLLGPDDGHEFGLDVPSIVRSVFIAANGSHEDWDAFDRIMADERRCAVFVRAETISANPGTG
jgi:hypothetical protein